LSSRYGKATEQDMEKAMRVLAYFNRDKDTHCLLLKARSLEIIVTADASYAEHIDARSQTGG